ncbi:hypothetical protein LINGRAHAP2_LOCUS3506, partial [Linum grandiflorum]
LACRAPCSLFLPFFLPGSPLTLAITYISSSSQPKSTKWRGQSGLSGQPSFELR